MSCLPGHQMPETPAQCGAAATSKIGLPVRLASARPLSQVAYQAMPAGRAAGAAADSRGKSRSGESGSCERAVITSAVASPRIDSSGQVFFIGEVLPELTTGSLRRKRFNPYRVAAAGMARRTGQLDLEHGQVLDGNIDHLRVVLRFHRLGFPEQLAVAVDGEGQRQVGLRRSVIH